MKSFAGTTYRNSESVNMKLCAAALLRCGALSLCSHAQSIVSMGPFAKSGKLRIVVTTGVKRFPGMEDIRARQARALGADIQGRGK